MLADRFDAFLLDLDGVVYLGDRPLPGVCETLATLRTAAKLLRFVTNDPRPSRHDVVDKLGAMGIAAGRREIVTSGWVAACWLRAHLPSGGSVAVVGSVGLADELRQAGVRVAEQGEQPAAVLLGCDESVGYRDLRRAVQAIYRGALFVATNRDATFPMPDGPWPATGALVQAVEVSTGKSPLIVGKPYSPIFERALASLGDCPDPIPPERIAMIGDSIEADVAGARAVGITAIWLDREGKSPAISPDYTIHSLDELLR